MKNKLIRIIPIVNENFLIHHQRKIKPFWVSCYKKLCLLKVTIDVESTQILLKLLYRMVGYGFDIISWRVLVKRWETIEFNIPSTLTVQNQRYLAFKIHFNISMNHTEPWPHPCRKLQVRYIRNFPRRKIVQSTRIHKATSTLYFECTIYSVGKTFWM